MVVVVVVVVLAAGAGPQNLQVPPGPRGAPPRFEQLVEEDDRSNRFRGPAPLQFFPLRTLPSSDSRQESREMGV